MNSNDSEAEAGYEVRVVGEIKNVAHASGLARD
jgi:hypothetical protein